MQKKFWVLLLSAFFLCGAVSLAGATLIQNGDFETDDLTGWRLNNVNNVDYSTGGGGNTVAVLDVDGGDGWANLSQEFYVDPNWLGISVEFDVHFSTGSNTSFDVFKETVGFQSGGNTYWAWKYKIQTAENLPETGWWYHAKTVVPFDELGFVIDGVDPNAKLLFSLHENRGDWSWARLDNIEVNRVPEPATMMLLGLGLLGLVGASRKKIRK